MKTRVRIQYLPVYPAYIAKAPKSLRLPDNPPRALPFNRDKAHTIPTRWGLYRALLRHSGQPRQRGLGDGVIETASERDERETVDGLPCTAEAGTSARPLEPPWPQIHEMVRSDWRKHRNNTSAIQARDFLTHYYSVLSQLRSQSPESQAELRSMETMAEKTFATLREEQERRRAEDEALRASRRNARGRLTGGFLWPTHFLPPLPKLVPQPPKISGMYRARLRRRDLRILRLRDIDDALGDIKEEIRFLSRLGKMNDDWDLHGPGGWVESMDVYRQDCVAKLRAEEARAKTLFTEDVILKVRRARKERHKTYISFAWQRKDKRLANAAKRTQMREAFWTNRRRNEELKTQRLERAAEGETRNMDGAKGMYWDRGSGGGYKQRKRKSGQPKVSLKEFMEKSSG